MPVPQLSSYQLETHTQALPAAAEKGKRGKGKREKEEKGKKRKELLSAGDAYTSSACCSNCHITVIVVFPSIANVGVVHKDSKDSKENATKTR